MSGKDSQLGNSATATICIFVDPTCEDCSRDLQHRKQSVRYRPTFCRSAARLRLTSFRRGTFATGDENGVTNYRYRRAFYRPARDKKREPQRTNRLA